MSELKMIVDQAVEEMGGWNDAAIDRWSELAGVDIRSIDENTPFDIDIANKLLATFPQVMQEMKSKGEPSPDEVMSDLSEIAESLGEALGMDQQPQKPDVEEPQELVPEVDLETGLPSQEPEEPEEKQESVEISAPQPVESPETPPPAEPVQPEPASTPGQSSSIDELMKELESLAAEVNVMSEEESGTQAGAPGFKEEVKEEVKEGEETPAQATAPEPTAEEIAQEISEEVSQEIAKAEVHEPEQQEIEAPSEALELPSQPEEAAEAPVQQPEEVPLFPEETVQQPLAQETEEAAETPVFEEQTQEMIEEPVQSQQPAEAPVSSQTETPEPEEAEEAAQPLEIPQPIAQELEAATRIIDEMESPEFDLASLEKTVPGFQAACVIKDDKIIARHSSRHVEWAEIIHMVNSTNSVFSGALGLSDKAWEEITVGLGNLFLIGFLHKDVQVIVVVKSEKLGAARAWVSAAIKKL